VEVVLTVHGERGLSVANRDLCVDKRFDFNFAISSFAQRIADGSSLKAGSKRYF
jgi:hypothetical protein